MKKQKIVLQKHIHLEYDREPLHPVFESCLDGVSSLKKMEENLFTKLRSLDEMFPFCEDFEFIKQIEYNSDKTSYSSWYELIGTVSIQTGIQMNVYETMNEAPKNIEDLTVVELKKCIDDMCDWILKGDERLGKELESKMQADMVKKVEFFRYTYYMLLPERERNSIFEAKEFPLFEWQR